jgi:hypothetical protein
VYARVATFERSDMSRMDEMIETVKERMEGDAPPHPAMKGGLMLVDREGGRTLGITFFDTREAIQDAEATFARMGDEIPEELRGRRVGVDVYEVAAEQRL